MLTPREIIAQSWRLTTTERKLKEWGFIYALFETLREIEIVLYQVYFLYWYFRGSTVGWLSVESLFFERMPLWLAMVITVILLLLFVCELFIPTIATGAIIGLAAKAHRKEPVAGGLVLGLYNFFPILEIHGLFVFTSFSVVFTICSLLLRYGGDDNIKAVAIMVVMFLWLIASLFKLFSIFAEEAVVIRKAGVFHSIGMSFKLIISYLGQLMFLGLLMIVISLRVLINALMLLIVPAIIIALGLLLTRFLPPVVSYPIIAVVGLILVGFFSYFVAYLHVFRQTVWTLTFMELSKEKELDKIEG